MEAALIALFAYHFEHWMKEYYPKEYNNTQEVIEEYHVDDAAQVYKVIRDEKITFTWEW